MKKPPQKSASKGTKRPATKRAEAKTVAAAPPPAGGVQVNAWENDPCAQLTPTDPPHLATPILRPAPSLSPTDPLPIRITTQAPKPAGQFTPGTPEFRYWSAAEALRRGADFWSRISGRTIWNKSVGKILPVLIDNGSQLNAFYDRKELQFFHGPAPVFGTVYSGESPDIVCHELGHAVLDSIRPQLFNAGFIETAAFHESFGDMSALLSNLQVPSMRQTVLSETHGDLSRSSSLSRLAEQLGYAIRKQSPNAVDRDCLRNAANAFFYRDPSTLPPSAPAAALSTEPHSFSRVFTGAFLEVLAGMFNQAGPGGTADQLLATSEKAARYLLAGIRNAPVVPNYYSQVASAIVHAADAGDRHVVAGGFVHHGVLSLGSASLAVTGAASPAGRAAAAAPLENAKPDLAAVAVAGAEYGIAGAESILVHAVPESDARYSATGAAFASGATPVTGADRAAKDYLEDLLQQGRVQLGDTDDEDGPQLPFDQPHKRKTHKISATKEGWRLVRLRFDCGCESE